MTDGPKNWPYISLCLCVCVCRMTLTLKCGRRRKDGEVGESGGGGIGTLHRNEIELKAFCMAMTKHFDGVPVTGGHGP